MHDAHKILELAIVLTEDACAFNRLATVLKFSTKYVPVIKSMMTMTNHGFRSSIGPEVGKPMQRKIVQHARRERTYKAKATLMKPTKPVTLIERTMKLSSEFHALNAGIGCESLRGVEQQQLRFGEAARSRAASTSSHSETHQTQSFEEDKSTGATFFADDDFDTFCKSLMGTELDDDDGSDVIALAGPPPDVSFKSVVPEDESDDLVMLDGPPPNVCFSRRTETPQDGRLQFQSAEPTAKRAKLTLLRKNAAQEDQQSTRFLQGLENSISEADGMVNTTLEESSQHRSTLPIDGENVATIGSQQPQAQPEALPQPSTVMMVRRDLPSPISLQPESGSTNAQEG